MTQNTRSLYEENSRNQKMFGVYSQWYLVCLLTEVTLRNTQLQLPVVLCSSRGDVSHSRCFVKVEMPPNCSAVNCLSKRSDKSISFHTFPSDALRLVIWLKYCVPGFKPSKHSVLCSLHFDQSLMTWTPRRKSNRLANSKLNPIDLDAHPEAEPQEELDIANLNTPVKVSVSHSESDASCSAINNSVQHNISPVVSLPSVRRRLIVDSASPLKRARLDKTCETTSLTDNNLEFNSTVDGLSFVDSEQASLSDVVNFSPNINGFIDDLNRLTEEDQRLKQDYESNWAHLKEKFMNYILSTSVISIPIFV
ncbi:THAP domain-containing 2-like protein [Daphnia magna]|nr:THAP domain-containing 2-like protein [Daphnia magna]